MQTKGAARAGFEASPPDSLCAGETERGSDDLR
jgi:hypothetical protein